MDIRCRGGNLTKKNTLGFETSAKETCIALEKKADLLLKLTDAQIKKGDLPWLRCPSERREAVEIDVDNAIECLKKAISLLPPS